MTMIPHSPQRRRASTAAVALLVGLVPLAACGGERADPTTPTELGSPASAPPVATDAAPTTTPVSAAAPTTAIDPATTPTTTPAATAPPTTVAAVPASTGTAGDPVAAAPVSIDARAYGVFDLTGDRWLAGQGLDDQLAVGSIMKLLTARVVMQAGDPGRVVTVPDLQLDPMESNIALAPGEQFPRDVLLRAMLIVSANDAARVLARDVGGDESTFVAMMNDAAEALGLTGTVAANPTGLDQDGAHSTVRDVVRLSSVLLQDPAFDATVARTSAHLHGADHPASNDLLSVYQGADGIKTGTTTDAGHCLAASATRDGRRIVVVVLGSSSDDSRVAAASGLLDWAFAQPAG